MGGRVGKKGQGDGVMPLPFPHPPVNRLTDRALKYYLPHPLECGR